MSTESNKTFTPSTGTYELNHIKDGKVIHTDVLGKTFLIINISEEDKFWVRSRGSHEEVLELINATDHFFPEIIEGMEAMSEVENDE